MTALPKIILVIIAVIVFASCRPRRNLVYFSNLSDSENYNASITNNIEPLIQPNDILQITVSSLNAESNNLFNGRPVNATTPNENNQNQDGYLVDKNGSINFPVIGGMHVAGSTIYDVRQKLTAAIQAYIKNPIINVKFQNFRVTVMGEVNRPGTFTVTNNRISLIEALGEAGDMTAYGKRENVLIMRERDNHRMITRVNMNDKSVLSSPFFYLQQNDVVYVQPDKVKAAQVTGNDRWLPVIVSIASIIAIVLTRK